MDSKRRAPSYVCIPRHVVANPPIKHRHTTDSEWHLTPFQFAVGCAVLNIARAVLADDLHNRALERGAKAIAKEVATGESYFEQLKMLRAKGYNGKAS